MNELDKVRGTRFYWPMKIMADKIEALEKEMAQLKAKRKPGRPKKDST